MIGAVFFASALLLADAADRRSPIEPAEVRAAATKLHTPVENVFFAKGKGTHPAPPTMPAWAKGFNRDLNKLSDLHEAISNLSASGPPVQSINASESVIHGVPVEKVLLATGKDVHPVPPKMPEWAKGFNRDLNKLTHLKEAIANLSASGDPTKYTNHKTQLSLVSKPSPLTFTITPKKAAPLHFMMAAAAQSCKCEFKEMCSCYASMEFMDCISASCSSGLCDCPADLYQNACTSMAGTCGSLDFKCTLKRATCLSDSESEMVKSLEDHKPSPPKPVADIYEQLQSLKERKCRLALERADGYVNVDDKISLVEHDIGNLMDDLIERVEKQPEMHCEKHFEEWTVPQNHPERSSAQVQVAAANAIFLLVVFAAHVI